ncbi:MAG TPA: hypothetical protein VHQ65_11070 [Thermoanaerobaculia bacterium]|nr:hypothetical protein [Thermoanaerobaculia bacterium]
MTPAPNRTRSLPILSIAALALLLVAPLAAAQKELVTGSACFLDDPTNLQCGAEVGGVLSNDDCVFEEDGTRFDLYEFSADEGDIIGISVDSTDFQPVVALYAPGATNPIELTPAQSDVHAALGFQIPQTGIWRVAVNTLTEGERGNYTLAVDCFVGATAPDFGPCTETATEMCLNDDRFRVEAFWETRDGNSDDARTERMTPDTGYLWFFRDSNVEAVVKVLDGCPVNNHYWMFAGGLTNVLTMIRVTDTLANEVKLYYNPQGQPFRPIQDTTAFATCP